MFNFSGKLGATVFNLGGLEFSALTATDLVFAIVGTLLGVLGLIEQRRSRAIMSELKDVSTKLSATSEQLSLVKGELDDVHSELNTVVRHAGLPVSNNVLRMDEIRDFEEYLERKDPEFGRRFFVRAIPRASILALPLVIISAVLVLSAIESRTFGPLLLLLPLVLFGGGYIDWAWSTAETQVRKKHVENLWSEVRAQFDGYKFNVDELDRLRGRVLDLPVKHLNRGFLSSSFRNWHKDYAN
ncbi:MAG: hypothetical protein AAFR00_06165 [Pseudomonadota bacterium]